MTYEVGTKYMFDTPTMRGVFECEEVCPTSGDGFFTVDGERIAASRALAISDWSGGPTRVPQVGDTVEIQGKFHSWLTGTFKVTECGRDWFKMDKSQLQYKVFASSTVWDRTKILDNAPESTNTKIAELTTAFNRKLGNDEQKEDAVEQAEVYQTKPEQTVENTAHDLVDLTLEVEAAKLQAEYRRKIVKRRAELAAIKDGVKTLDNTNWWNATVDMTPLSLTALMAAVASVSALTAALIPIFY
jgi:hypothetical protein